mgnify:FL=1
MKIIRRGTQVQLRNNKALGFIVAAVIYGSQDICYRVSYAIPASGEITHTELKEFEFTLIGEKIHDEIGFKQ